MRGPAEEVWAFRTAAAGAGLLPWGFDDFAAEARWVEGMLAIPAHQRAIGAAGVRVLAGELRAAWLTEHEEAAAEVGRARHCPLDLHALVPVPSAVLALGADHPAALRWLWENWGTTWPLRQVRVLQDRPGSGAGDAAEATIVYGFCAADWPPWQAVLRLRREWPHLRFELWPEHG